MPAMPNVEVNRDTMKPAGANLRSMESQEQAQAEEPIRNARQAQSERVSTRDRRAGKVGGFRIGRGRYPTGPRSGVGAQSQASVSGHGNTNQVHSGGSVQAYPTGLPSAHLDALASGQVATQAPPAPPAAPAHLVAPFPRNSRRIRQVEDSFDEKAEGGSEFESLAILKKRPYSEDSIEVNPMNIRLLENMVLADKGKNFPIWIRTIDNSFVFIGEDSAGGRNELAHQAQICEKQKARELICSKYPDPHRQHGLASLSEGHGA